MFLWPLSHLEGSACEIADEATALHVTHASTQVQQGSVVSQSCCFRKQSEHSQSPQLKSPGVFCWFCVTWEGEGVKLERNFVHKMGTSFHMSARRIGDS